ncbi:MAG TPA: DUF4097 family beta strand repeat-containing protein [Steroidobacteraceae bacterium]|nr:DUF4097 family beta strand repeat-containing protein [Steroidobacteraceae bacterium]
MLRYLVIACVLTISGCSARAAEKNLDRTFTVTPGGTLSVDAQGASVHVSGHDGNQVVVHMLLRGPERQVEGATLDAVQTDEGVTVTMRQRSGNWFGGWGNWGKREIEVSVPRQYAIDVHTSGGSIALRDTTGNATARTSGGSLRAENITGNVELKTSGGSIETEAIQGDVDAGTSGGSIRLLRVDGKISAKTSGGSVRCELAGANRGISARTSGGSIELTLPDGTTGNIDASTSGGRVSSDFPVTVTEQERSRLVGALNGGGAPIYAHTSGGSISLRTQH